MLPEGFASNKIRRRYIEHIFMLPVNFERQRKDMWHIKWPNQNILESLKLEHQYEYHSKGQLRP